LENLDLPKGSPYPKQLSVGSDGTMFALNINDEIYHRNNETWEKIDGLCSQIEVADYDTIFCVNKDG
jgi:Tectonin domain